MELWAARNDAASFASEVGCDGESSIWAGVGQGVRNGFQGSGVVVSASVSPGADANMPSASRMYDYYLGGSHHLAADREAAGRVLSIAPWTREMAVDNRSFLRRVVTYLVAEAKVRQFLDLGSGIPTVGNVHEVAQEIAPETRVVYVDVDPVAVAHARLVLTGIRNAVVVGADIRDPAAVLGHPALQSLLDLDAPVAILMISILPFIADEDRPGELVAAYLNTLAAGSFLAISHASPDGLSPELLGRVGHAAQTYAKAGQPVTLRGVNEIASWFDGLELVEPGLVSLPDWRPDGTGANCGAMISYGGLGRVP